jgi:GTPase SAR1 family protein
MANEAATDAPQVSLQSKDHEELLNIIDDLRGQGISRYIDLPQLIVCGDQSSGKSSVLEAVSGLRFPTKDNLCTRFATELILRRGPDSSATVTIVPGEQRTDIERQRLQAFRSPTTALDDFATIIGSAEEAMGLDQNTKAFSNDILRVEITGPKQPHLTLVDLPGLFHASNKAQSEQDAASVKSLVLSYMKKPRSIILAVVSAKNDYANQIVTKYARDLDRLGNRTLGIITKPDTLHAGSDSERSFVELAENKDVNFRLGWHVLRNRDYDSRDSSADERDRAEAEFFSQGIWTSLPPSHMGIGSLKPRLSRVLKDQILSELPNMIQDVENGVKDCRGRLELLGSSRATIPEQRLHLLRVSQLFSSLVKAAIDGVYVDSFFGDPKTDDGYSKRLRAVTQNTLIEFSATIRRQGHAKDITEDPLKTSDIELVGRSKDGNPVRISREAYIDEVQDLMKRTRGCELPGTFNPQIIGELFYEQSRPWQAIVESFMAQLLDAARMTLNLVLEHTADPQTSEGLLRHIINPAIEPLKERLEAKAKEVLEPHQRGHPITYNHHLTDNIHKSRQKEWDKLLTEKVHGFFGTSESNCLYNKAFDVRQLLTALRAAASEADMDRHACSEAIDCMQAYYKVSTSNCTGGPLKPFRSLAHPQRPQSHYYYDHNALFG